MAIHAFFHIIWWAIIGFAVVLAITEATKPWASRYVGFEVLRLLLSRVLWLQWLLLGGRLGGRFARVCYINIFAKQQWLCPPHSLVNLDPDGCCFNTRVHIPACVKCLLVAFLVHSAELGLTSTLASNSAHDVLTLCGCRYRPDYMSRCKPQTTTFAFEQKTDCNPALKDTDFVKDGRCVLSSGHATLGPVSSKHRVQGLTQNPYLVQVGEGGVGGHSDGLL
jgi:hypothetical protein